ncbi:MAG: hypothetical protein BGO01_18475 [Armatimonadetes bacterium 55-13]|nr:hypothetical protein [Armatimonadota bacterium]OJU64119.1 MAG: hypothetical protein BGO01_18475 [Armatimonadetes bacterium 55-13]
MEVGVLVVDSERMAGKRLETLYAPASTRFSVDRTDRSPEFREAVAAGTRLMLRLVGREYAAHNKNGDSSLEATIRLNLRLSPGQIHQLRQKLMEIGDWASSLEEEGGEVDVNLTAFLIPKD